MFYIGTSGFEQSYLQANSFICLYPEENDGLFFLGGVFMKKASQLVALKA